MEQGREVKVLTAEGHLVLHASASASATPLATRGSRGPPSFPPSAQSRAVPGKPVTLQTIPVS